MPKWTKEQNLAIHESGKNIIVSAGAGSGKTAVLTERVVEKLRCGIKLNELLILTFTAAAAGEMKDRISSKIKKEREIKDNLDLLESSYITTFDSFTLSLVKKYHYLLNVSSSLNIIDDGVIAILKDELLDDVFESLYEEENEQFLNFIDTFTIKNDVEIKKSILRIIESIDLKSDKEDYLNNYLENFYSDSYYDELYKKYLNLIYSKIKMIEDNLYLLENSDYPDYYDKVVGYLDRFIHSKSYNDLKLFFPSSTFPTRPKNSDDIKDVKDSISTSLKEIKELLRFKDEEDIKESYFSTKDYVSVIITIIKRFNERLNKYKAENDLYTFTDIEIMAIDLLKENPEILMEVKNSYAEIMVDEYQDTSDLQEEFISLIENDNVYMVGDIKQSIYRFRNANPDIFKNKYDNYATSNGGIKIDLLQNFRSRNEVLKGINEIFNLVMHDEIGGANYQKDHQMKFGNMAYEDNKASQNYELEILNYEKEDIFSKEEMEAFIIGSDIKKKIANHYQVFDKKEETLRDAKYEDFCIIMDRGNAFDLYKKIFSYLGLPLDIYQNQKLTSETDVILIYNILGLAIKIKESKLDQEFKYYFTSIARSFLFSMNDNEILKIFNKDSFCKTDIYHLGEKIASHLDTDNNYELLQVILNETKFYEKLIIKGDISDSEKRIENLLEVALSVGKLGYSPYEFKDYLLKIIESNHEISYKDSISSSSSIKIMNIHKSKGLEFPICYFSGYHKEFNQADLRDRYLFDNKLGIIVPYFNEGIGSTICKDLLKDKYSTENISESIRLLYVALTRAKEKMIIVTSLEDEKRVISPSKYNSFLSIITSIKDKLTKYIKKVNNKDLSLTKDYLYSKGEKVLESNDKNAKLVFSKIDIPNETVEEKHASKVINKLISEAEKKTLEYGTYMHEIFEQADFNSLDIKNPFYEKLHIFVQKLDIDSNVKIYKEHEFIFEKDKQVYHGIIDLVLEYKDEIKIVDYKLKNIDDENYLKQLDVYKKYMSLVSQKPISLYLYSIMDNDLREIK